MCFTSSSARERPPPSHPNRLCKAEVRGSNRLGSAWIRCLAINHPRRVAGRVVTPEAKADPARLGQVAEPKQTQLRAKYLKAYAALGREDLVQSAMA
jgi:hypothetical protein